MLWYVYLFLSRNFFESGYLTYHQRIILGRLHNTTNDIKCKYMFLLPIKKISTYRGNLFGKNNQQICIQSRNQHSWVLPPTATYGEISHRNGGGHLSTYMSLEKHSNADCLFIRTVVCLFSLSLSSLAPSLSLSVASAPVPAAFLPLPPPPP